MRPTPSTLLIPLLLALAAGSIGSMPASGQTRVAGDSPVGALRIVPDHEPPDLRFTTPVFDASGRTITESDSVTLSGTVSDATGVARLLIGGEIVTVADGRFSRTIPLREGTTILPVLAEDTRGNVATRTLTLERTGRWAPGTAQQIPDASPNRNALAISIGIERYRSLPLAAYADNDARRFAEYARRALGVPSDRIYLAVNEDATLGELRKVFDPSGWLDRRATEDSDIYVFFSGHGFRNPEIEHQGYLIPYEAEPLYAGMNYPLEALYEALGRLKARTVTVFIDACFSGFSRGRDFLLGGSRGPMAFDIRTTLEGTELRYPHVLVFTAADNLQFGASTEQGQHGLFTYYLLRGLRGEADDTSGDGDRVVTAEELFRYISTRVHRAALDLGHEQTPVLSGRDLDRPLVRY